MKSETRRATEPIPGFSSDAPTARQSDVSSVMAVHSWMTASGTRLLVLFMLLAFHAVGGASEPGSFPDKEPKVTRWRHPEGLGRAPHAPSTDARPLRLTLVGPGSRRDDAAPRTEGRVCVVVAETIYASVQARLSQYEDDLVSTGFSVIVYVYASGSAADLRAHLLSLYVESESLRGAVLVGNIPYIIYEMMQDWDGSGGDPPQYEDFACDIFYMDLNGQWSDILSDGGVQPGNGKYDSRSGHTGLEIWVSRMRTHNLAALGSESSLLNAYFDKNHRYRDGYLCPIDRGLVYDDDDWADMASGDAMDLGWIYGPTNVVTVSEPESTTASDYKANHMTAPHELMLVRSHGYPGGHGFYQNGQTQFHYVYRWDYTSYDPVAVFYSLFVCSGADYTADNYLAGTISFNPDDSGLLSWGSTKTGGMWADHAFYTSVSDGASFGEAFKGWFNYVQTYYPTLAPRWWYGMVLIGDGTLVPTMGTALPPPTHLTAALDQETGEVELHWTYGSRGFHTVIGDTEANERHEVAGGWSAARAAEKSGRAYSTTDGAASEGTGGPGGIGHPPGGVVSSARGSLPGDRSDCDGGDTPEIPPPRDSLHFVIYRDGTSVASVTDTSFTDSLPSPGTYEYVVTAVYGDGESDPSEQVTVTWGIGIDLSLSLGESSLILGWTPYSGAVAYWVYGADNAPFFSPGLASPYSHRQAVLPSGTLLWSTTLSIENPDHNWSFLVIAVGATGGELARSNRGGEWDYPLATW